MIRITENGVIITVNVTPRSRAHEIKIEGDKIYVKVTSPPIGGKANKEVIELLADFLGVKKKQLEIIEGEKSRVKKILVRTSDQEELLKRLRS